MKKFIISLVALMALVSCGNNTAKTTTSDVDSTAVETVVDSTDVTVSSDTTVLK